MFRKNVIICLKKVNQKIQLSKMKMIIIGEKNWSMKYIKKIKQK